MKHANNNRYHGRTSKSPDHRQRPRRVHRRHLRLARQPQAGALRRHRTGRTADDDHRRREFPGTSRQRERSRPDGADAQAGRAVRRRHPHGQRHARRPLVASVPRRDRRREGDQGRNADHRHGSHGQIPRSPVRDQIPRAGRQRLRHVRRIFLPQKGRGRGGRRRHGLRGGHLPRIALPPGLPDRAQTPPARLEGDAAAGVQHAEHRSAVRAQHRRGAGRRLGRNGRAAAQERRLGAEDRHRGILPGDRPTRNFSPNSWRSTPKATSRSSRERRRPRSKASSPPAT